MTWYNAYRPHETLGGATPIEIRDGSTPANQRPRLEFRERWPRGSPCAAPQAEVDAGLGTVLELHLEFLEGRPHLPIVKLREVA